MLVVVDPFHNRLVFHQPVAEGVEPRATEAAGPIEHTYELDCTVEEAFDAFTRRIGEWWHPAYAPEGLERIEIDGEVGGRASMHLADGTTYPWGTVTVWEPPRHYAQTFTLAQDQEHPSTLEVLIEPTEARGRGTADRGSPSPTAAGPPATSRAGRGSPSGGSCSTGSPRWPRGGRCPTCRPTSPESRRTSVIA